MSERKVLNKYYPPDFDPSKIPRRSGPKNSQQVVRLMAPFSMRCNTCGEYIYKGKKFNARKETVDGEDYYGIKIFRFYIKCTLCSAEITFKTDPKNTDYAAEHGASRNFEPWREVEIVEEEDRLAKLEEEENNPIKVLENRTQDSKREMDILDALQDLRARNARHERVAGSEVVNDALDSRIEVLDEEDLIKKQQDEEDNAIIQQYFSRIPDPSAASSSTATLAVVPSGLAESDGDMNTPSTDLNTLPLSTPSTITIKRKADFSEPDIESMMVQAKAAMSKPTPTPTPAPAHKKARKEMASLLGIRKKPKGKV